MLESPSSNVTVVNTNVDNTSKVVIVGAGPAGLTSAFELCRREVRSVILEASNVVGGISQTAVRDGWRFDLGGHRFFTKVSRVEAFWHEILAEDDFLLRPRMSRILYGRKFYDYPLRAKNALFNLGPIEATKCMLSYGVARIRPPKDQSHFEGWVSARFGQRLYSIFFKTYTEKVWGIPANTIQADWAAQRIKNLNLGRAVVNAILKPKGQTEVTSLIDRFQYPRLGPGMMWEACAKQVTDKGVEIHFDSKVASIEWSQNRVHTVIDSNQKSHPCDTLISTMAMNELIAALNPSPPEPIVAAAKALNYRNFITVALITDGQAAFDDNWIYVHDQDVRLGRIQNFASWSPEMVKPGQTCLGLEYFVDEGDDLSTMSHEDLIALGTSEVEKLGLVNPGSVVGGHVVHVPKAYPMYDEAYKQSVETIRDWLVSTIPNINCVGRNGMHRYNNQDHSMLTAMLTVDNLFGATNDVWAVNVDEEYHEEISSSDSTFGQTQPPKADQPKLAENSNAEPQTLGNTLPSFEFAELTTSANV